MKRKLENGIKEERKSLLKKELIDLGKMPKKQQIIGEYLGLFGNGIKSKNKKVAKITEELIDLWEKLNFPVVTK